ncbi:MAG TPA: hypothetical protein VFF03_03300 [Rhodocyclaceae bacterium]|nr:hypothetical protein [Rhodocyclaceae bacterium]
MKTTLSLCAGLWLAAAPALAAPDLFWLSDAAPKKAPRPAAEHQHGSGSEEAAMGGDEADTIHSPVKRLWFRQGRELAEADYLKEDEATARLSLLDALGNRSQAGSKAANGAAQVTMTLKELGFNNAYAQRDQVQDQVRWVQLAKTEVLKGSCCVREMDPAQEKPISDPAQPLEIVRQRQDKEKMFTRIVSGDTVQFTVLRFGQPAARVPVTMYTQQGWTKTAASDAEGKVSFTLIRDYFPEWSDFRRRTKESFVVAADMEVAEAGSFNGQPYGKVHYQATLSGRYAPSPYDYKSYGYGLGIAVFVFAFGGLGVYAYRRRRVKPFQEIRFGEGA